MSFRPALALLVAALATHASALPADSRITAIMVCADAAVVTRTAALELTSVGETEVTFENLPATLIDRSLKATVGGTAQARVLAVTGSPPAANRLNTTVTLSLEVTRPGSFDLTLTYAVPGASWTPTYEAHVLPGERAMQFDFFALVRQKTGEDWENVGLTLSTLNSDGARSQTYAAPTIPGPTTAQRSGPVPKPPPALTPPAPPATFKVPATSTVKGDDAPAKVAVASGRLASENDFRITVGWADTTFPSLSIAATNPFAFPLLAGPVNVFLGETGNARSIRTVMPGESFHFSQLYDKSFSVRRSVHRVEDDGPLNQTWRITYDVTLRVRNNLPIAEQIQINYSVPQPGVSGSRKTTVVRLLPPTAPEANIQSSGGLRWNLALAPGEIRELPVKFSIEFLDTPIRQGHVKIGELQIVDDRTPAAGAAKP